MSEDQAEKDHLKKVHRQRHENLSAIMVHAEQAEEALTALMVRAREAITVHKDATDDQLAILLPDLHKLKDTVFTRVAELSGAFESSQKVIPPPRPIQPDSMAAATHPKPTFHKNPSGEPDPEIEKLRAKDIETSEKNAKRVSKERDDDIKAKDEAARVAAAGAKQRTERDAL